LLLKQVMGHLGTGDEPRECPVRVLRHTPARALTANAAGKST